MCERRLQGQEHACPATWPDRPEQWCDYCRHQYDVWLAAQADEARGDELVGASPPLPDPLRPVLTMAAYLDALTDDWLWHQAWTAPRPGRPPGQDPPTN